MDVRKITDGYHVAHQLDPADIPALKEAGFRTIINNRPDEEIPPHFQADAMEAAVSAAGMEYRRLAITHQTMTPDNIALQKSWIADCEGPILAYCATGTRCTVIWALGQAGEMDADDILSTAQAGGYDLGHLRPMLTRD